MIKYYLSSFLFNVKTTVRFPAGINVNLWLSYQDLEVGAMSWNAVLLRSAKLQVAGRVSCSWDLSWSGILSEAR